MSFRTSDAVFGFLWALVAIPYVLDGEMGRILVLNFIVLLSVYSLGALLGEHPSWVGFWRGVLVSACGVMVGTGVVWLAA